MGIKLVSQPLIEKAVKRAAWRISGGIPLNWVWRR